MSSFVACSGSWTSSLATACRFSIAAGAPSGFPYTSTSGGALSPVARPSLWPSCVGWYRGSRSWAMDRSAEPWCWWMHATTKTTRTTGRRMAVVERGMGAEEEVERCRPVLRARSEEELLSCLRNEVESGRLKSDIAARLEELYYSYRNAVMQSENPSAREIVLSNMAVAFDRIILDVEVPFSFPPYHKSIREPFDYYMFGQNYIRPLVDFRTSYVGNISVFFDIEEKLKQGHNVVMFSNHQTEADPAIIALLLERTNPYIAESMVFVAGDRVVTDPLCKPFSMGRNLICVYSKKHMNDIPELVEMKRKSNTRSLKEMAMLLRGGSQLIWIAPSGGRDRSDPLTGKWHPSPFDASSVDNMRRLVEHCDVPGHIYPLALQCYEVMPPPEEVEKEIGERRKIAFHGVGLSVAPEMNFYETTSGCMDPEESKEVFSQALYDIVTEQYNVLNSAIYGCQGISASNSIISLSQPWI